MDKDRLKLVIEGVVIIAVVLVIVLIASPSAWAPRENPIAASQQRLAQFAFPADIPIPTMAGSGANGTAGSSVPVSTTSVALPNGQVQIKNSFLSTSTTSATFSFYKQFFAGSAASASAAAGAARGWMFLAQINNPQDPAHKSILARNASGMLTVNITAQTASTALVEMTFVSNP